MVRTNKVWTQKVTFRTVIHTKKREKKIPKKNEGKICFEREEKIRIKRYVLTTIALIHYQKKRSETNWNNKPKTRSLNMADMDQFAELELSKEDREQIFEPPTDRQQHPVLDPSSSR